MRRNFANKTIAAGCIALAMMVAASPVTAQAAGQKAIPAKGTISYIVMKDCSQNVIMDRVNLLGVSMDCFKQVEDILNQLCLGIPDIPCEPSEPSSPELPIAPEEPETPTVPESSFAARVIELVNEERAREGLKPLTYDAAIEQAALVRAKEIQTSFSHTRPNGTSFVTAMKEAGVSYRRAGENIAWGQKTPEQVVGVWMNSPSHRANIMNANYGRIGVGHLTNAGGTSYWVQLFAD